MTRLSLKLVTTIAIVAVPSRVLAVDVSCSENATTWTFKAGDLRPLNSGVRRDGGVGNQPTPMFSSGCFVELAGPITTAGAANIHVEVDHVTSWEGIINPLSPAKGPNRILYNVETSLDSTLEINHFRLGQMRQTVLWTNTDGRYAVDASSRPGRLMTPVYSSDIELDRINIQICEIHPNVDVVIKDIRVQVDIYDPAACGGL